MADPFTSNLFCELQENLCFWLSLFHSCINRNTDLTHLDFSIHRGAPYNLPGLAYRERTQEPNKDGLKRRRKCNVYQSREHHFFFFNPSHKTNIFVPVILFPISCNAHYKEAKIRKGGWEIGGRGARVWEKRSKTRGKTSK